MCAVVSDLVRTGGKADSLRRHQRGAHKSQEEEASDQLVALLVEPLLHHLVRLLKHPPQRAAPANRKGEGKEKGVSLPEAQRSVLQQKKKRQLAPGEEVDC